MFKWVALYYQVASYVLCFHSAILNVSKASEV